MIGVLVFILLKLILPSLLHHFLGFKTFLCLLHLGWHKVFFHLLCHLLVLKNWIFEPFLHNILSWLIFGLSFFESILHADHIWLNLGYLLTVNDNLSVFYSLKKVNKLRILKSGIWIVHHYVKHRVRTVENVFLFLIVWNLCVFECILHDNLILPAKGLLFEFNLFELLVKHVFLHFHSLLSLHPIMLMHHFHLLFNEFLFDHCFVEALVHECILLCKLCFYLKKYVLESPQV